MDLPSFLIVYAAIAVFIRVKKLSRWIDKEGIAPFAASMNIEKKIKSIIAEQLSISEDEVSSEASFIDDLGADSLDIVELVMAMEEEFEMEIPDEDAEKLLSVQDVIDYVKKRAQ